MYSQYFCFFHSLTKVLDAITIRFPPLLCMYHAPSTSSERIDVLHAILDVFVFDIKGSYKLQKYTCYSSGFIYVSINVQHSMTISASFAALLIHLAVNAQLPTIFLIFWTNQSTARLQEIICSILQLNSSMISMAVQNSYIQLHVLQNASLRFLFRDFDPWPDTISDVAMNGS